MANIGKKGLEIPETPVENGSTEASPGSQTTGLTPDQKFNLIMSVSIGVGVVSLLAMLGMLANWWQFANNASKDYAKVINEYADKRHVMLENRIKELENRISTQSAQCKQ